MASSAYQRSSQAVWCCACFAETWQEHCLLPADGHQVGVLRLFRYALDDLRLFQAIAEAGMLGRIVVSDQLAEAHVVVATRITRTGHDAPLKAVRRTAAKAGLPYVELEKVSGLRIMQALAPLMGIPVPCHLLRRKQPLMPVLSKAWPARPELASEEEEAQGKEDQLQPAAVLSVKRQANRCARANDVAQLHIASRPVRSAVTTPLLKAGLLLEPDVDDLDVQDDRQWMRPSNPKDVLGARRQLPAASEPGPSTPPPAKRSKRTGAEPAAESTKGKGKAQGKAAKAKPAPQPGRWLDRDCNAALNMQRIGESRWRPLELCFWPDQGALPAKGKQYPGLGYKRLRDKPPKAQQQQQQPAEAHEREAVITVKIVMHGRCMQWAGASILLHAAKMSSTIVPELLAKKQKRDAQWQAEKAAAALEGRKKAKLARKDIFKRAESYVREYRQEASPQSQLHGRSIRCINAQEADLIRLKREAKAKNGFYVPAEHKLMFVIRIKGLNKVHPKTKKILQLLRLRQINNAIFLRINKATLGLLKRVEPYIAFGYPNLKSVRELIYKRGFGKIAGNRVPLTDNKLIEENLGKYGIICMEDLVHEIYKVGPHFKEASNFLWPFQLSSAAPVKSRPSTDAGATRKRKLKEEGITPRVAAVMQMLLKPDKVKAVTEREVSAKRLEYYACLNASPYSPDTASSLGAPQLSTTPAPALRRHKPTNVASHNLVRPAWSQERHQPVRGLMWCPVVAPRKPPQAPRSSQAATQPAASEPGPSTPPPAKRSKRTEAEPAAEPTKGKGKGKGKAAEAKPAPQPGMWLDRDCNAALNMQAAHVPCLHTGDSDLACGAVPGLTASTNASSFPRMMRLHGAQEKVLERYFKKLEEEAASVSQQQWGARKQLVVFSGNAGIGTRGGWGAKAVLQACRNVVERPNSGKPTDRVPSKVVTVDEFSTSRVSSIMNSPQPCEKELDSSKPTRPEDWKHKPAENPPAPAQALLAQEPPGQEPPPHAQDQSPLAAPGPVQRPQAPPWGRWLDRDTNPCLNFQRMGESMQRPLELCSWKDREALTPLARSTGRATSGSMTTCPRSGRDCTRLQSTGGVLMAGPATMHRP
ncbi:hypothetical protein QJQ45_017667 [Haematococcus lacustris]|nr:hypothetical protein QJQ45_017667 [Haematococcus lacustris]